MKEIYGRLLHVYLLNFTYDKEDLVDREQLDYSNYKRHELLENRAHELDEEVKEAEEADDDELVEGEEEDEEEEGEQEPEPQPQPQQPVEKQQVDHNLTDEGEFEKKRFGKKK